MDEDWSSTTITTINWNNSNIVLDKTIDVGEEYGGEANFVYYPESEVRNNTNLNFNFLIFYSYGRVTCQILYLELNGVERIPILY